MGACCAAVVLSLLVASSWGQMTISELDPDSGLFFSHVTTAQVVAQYWRVHVTFNATRLSDNANMYLDLAEKFSARCDSTTKRLGKRNGDYEDEIDMCTRAVAEQRDRSNRIKLAKETLDRMSIRPRARRSFGGKMNGGWLSVGGSLLNEVFGVADQKTVHELMREQEATRNGMARMMGNYSTLYMRTSLVQRKMLREIRQRFLAIDNRERIQMRLDNLRDTYQNLINIGNDLVTEYTMINVAITAARAGHVDQNIIDVGALDDIVKDVMVQILGKSMVLMAGTYDHLYRVAPFDVEFERNHVIFTLSIPLVEPDKYEWYDIVPIPTKNGTTVDTRYGAIFSNMDNTRYYLLESGNKPTCKQAQYMVCEVPSTRYTTHSNAGSCEINMLVHRFSKVCTVKPFNYITQLQVKRIGELGRSYLYIAQEEVSITARCTNRTMIRQLTGVGIVTADSGCSMRAPGFDVDGEIVQDEANIAEYRVNSLIMSVQPNVKLMTSVANSSAKPILETVEHEFDSIDNDYERQRVLDLINMHGPITPIEAVRHTHWAWTTFLVLSVLTLVGIPLYKFIHTRRRVKRIVEVYPASGEIL
ncbi:CUN104 putative Ld130 envelope fusion protein, similar to AcMNPV ORF23 [Culex nigripalpus nucleopolyhedrovirus]|uniref:CUN104 putative Ld130 envelope fusion protein, similar to AcMNPV ORF23 n=1 Tax=Culex nigripalpus nucleopolyhedrovirus (isolate Florida/1997) TaxID=645993 RepID=Q919H3_NPVCO|nr:CUN104 putative Ld130 envelope fusion protein, similar to AcMNPV ORF23 [Culex nigripalpus nucleopolyhedrovirus]AAK94182.1 CUN104 putative Ld130 envelope fusion protein, similar to AcMNPV ORF23 [Culex nigripalpus nucleopolyhedrovirus]